MLFWRQHIGTTFKWRRVRGKINWVQLQLDIYLFFSSQKFFISSNSFFQVFIHLRTIRLRELRMFSSGRGPRVQWRNLTEERTRILPFTEIAIAQQQRGVVVQAGTKVTYFIGFYLTWYCYYSQCTHNVI